MSFKYGLATVIQMLMSSYGQNKQNTFNDPPSSVTKAVRSCSVSPAPLRVVLGVVVQNLPHLTFQPLVTGSLQQGGKEFDVEFVGK